MLGAVLQLFLSMDTSSCLKRYTKLFKFLVEQHMYTITFVCTNVKQQYL